MRSAGIRPIDMHDYSAVVTGQPSPISHYGTPSSIYQRAGPPDLAQVSNNTLVGGQCLQTGTVFNVKTAKQQQQQQQQKCVGDFVCQNKIALYLFQRMVLTKNSGPEVHGCLVTPENLFATYFAAVEQN